MQIALNAKDDRVSAEDAIKTEKYFCPCCGEEVILCKGAIRFPYFSHKPNSSCGIDDSDMCEWHIRLQSYFSKAYREVVFKQDSEIHRADIFKDGYVIEFQHSHISLIDFNKRNSFYKSLGYKIIWVFDTSDWLDRGRISYLNNYNESKFKVSRPLELWRNIVDDKDISICFCDYDDEGLDFIYNIYWHSPDFSRIMMDLTCGGIELSDNLDLGILFKSPQDRKRDILKGYSYTRVYRGIKGHNKSEYFCKNTNDWARDCENCHNCILAEYKEKGRVYYCNNKGSRDIDDNHFVESVYIT